MNQESHSTQRLAKAQELAARDHRAADTKVQARTSDNLSVRYRLYTERYDNLSKIVSFYFKGATLSAAVGLWEGTEEFSTVIEIIGTRAIEGSILAMAEDICAINNQSEILITSEPVKKYSVTRVSL